MNFIQFIRVILDHKFLILSVGFIMSITIYYGTRNEKKEYSSSAVVYTGLATGYNIESGSKQRFDLFATRVAFDNFINIIKSADTHEEVCLRLLSRHLVYDAQDIIDYSHLRKIFPDSIKYDFLDVFSIKNTKENLINYMQKSDVNKVYKLLRSTHKFYGMNKISSIKVQRVQSSDLLELSYTTEHPRICQETLEVLIDVFREKYRSIQSNRTSSVVQYFEDRVLKAGIRLDNAEKSLLKFRTDNQIINYYEQTKSIAEQKENLDHEHKTETMELASAQAALNHLKSTLGKKVNLGLQSKIILDIREELNEISTKIAILEIEDPDTPELLKKKRKAKKLKLNLEKEVGKLYEAGRSVSGVPVKNLLKEWLDNVIAVEERKARVEIILKTRLDFEGKYNTFAPLGSELKKIEREIKISEDEYMSFLKSWNEAKLRQQNIDMQSSSNSIKILDEPFYPLEAKKSKRMFLVVVGFLAGTIFTIAILIFFEFIDSSINNIERAEELTKLKSLGVFPNLNKKKTNLDYDYVADRVIEIMIQKIKLIVLSSVKKEKKPYLIILTSTLRNEGLNFLSDLFSDKLKSVGNNVMILSPNSKEENAKKNKNFGNYFKLFYDIKDNFFDVKNIKDLFKEKEDLFFASYDYIFLILPSLLHNEFPTNIVKNADLSLLICQSNRVWKKADTQVLDLYKKAINYDFFVILNGVRIEYLEDIIGEIPKKRSRIRKIIKNLISGNIKKSKYFNIF